jgi:hypothetical protein
MASTRAARILQQQNVPELITVVRHCTTDMIAHVLIVAIIAATLLLSSGLEIEENFNLKPRTQAPRFKAKAVLNDKFVNVALDEYISAKKWTVLLFYPFDYTFVCPVSSCYL